MLYKRSKNSSRLQAATESIDRSRSGNMKTVSLFLILATILCASQANAQFSDLCLPQPMREVPITIQIRRTSGLAVCSEDGLLALPQLASRVEEQIMNNYQPPPLYSDCEIVSLEHTSCETLGRRGQRVLIRYKVNITCSDGCYYLKGFEQKDTDAISLYFSQVDSVLNAGRAKSSAEFNYDGRVVEISYFRGKKGEIFSACSGDAMVQEGVTVNKKIPACRCPSNCSNPCTLPPETGRCRASIPRYYHNSDSGRCEPFTYGGCEGNQNRFTTQEECEKACKVCPAGKVYQECGTDCPETCENKDEGIRICNLRCVQGCFCPAGTVELGDKCVAPEDCSSSNTTAVEEEQCPEGMVYRQCGSACPPTCENKDEDVNCVAVCVTGCFCPRDKLLLEEDGETKCVDRDECPSVGGEECPEGKVYRQCGTACPLTCENKDDDVIPCTLQCVPGCFCPRGFVEKGDSCVVPEECELEADLCSLPPVTGLCLAYFHRYFYNKMSEQCEQFVYGGCGGNDNNFETVEECEARCSSGNETEEFECPNGKEYQECGTSCPTTCRNKDENRTCTSECVQGCFCPKGYVEKGDSCVAPEECELAAGLCSLPPEIGPCKAYFPRYFYNESSEQCEQFVYGGCGGNDNNFETVEECEAKCSGGNETEEFECPNGKEYQECGTSCPTTCKNKDEIRICTFECVQGCFCPSGTVELGDKCIAPDECPAVNTTVLPEEECPEGMIYNECGTACPTTCENKKDMQVQPCTLQCVQGCFCAGDTILLEEGGNECVSSDQCPSNWSG